MSDYIENRKITEQISDSSKVVCWGPYKVLLIGDATVGKSSILRRFTEGKFASDYYQPTVGIDYKRKVVRLTEYAGVKLHVWDTAGQERFRSLGRNYYRGADAILLIFDVTDPKSFIDLPSWLDELARYSASERNVFQILIGNKSDLGGERRVTTACGEALGDKYNLDYIEVSAKTGNNVDLVFTLIARALFLANQTMSEDEEDSGKTVVPRKSSRASQMEPPIRLNTKPQPKGALKCCPS